ncbi:MAG: hypothetical protein CM1200mP35_04140 [Chloroflexota bacterium]|nr:MAG: hypothetical protein CM1200mP35_04140 [Chloroflexota bacterium]
MDRNQPSHLDFYDDLKEHNASDNVVLLVFSEFGRRVHDNGSGTDHGSGGVTFVIGDSVKGGLYGEYPSLEEKKLLEGDLHFNNDFRSLYTSLLEDWMDLDAKPIVNGHLRKWLFYRTGNKSIIQKNKFITMTQP